jgi:transposase
MALDFPLLPHREAGEVANWLRQYPSIKVVSHDRANIYAEAARRGAPQALQVADKFHLPKNLTETVEVFLQRHTKLLREVATLTATSETLKSSKGSQIAALSATQLKKQAVVAKKQERYHQIQQPHKQGLHNREIGKNLGIGKSTVERYLKQPEAPKLKDLTPHQWNMLKPYGVYIVQRYNEERPTIKQIQAELAVQGLVVSRSTVGLFLAQLRPSGAYRLPKTEKSKVVKYAELRNCRLGPRQVAFLFTLRPTALRSWQKSYLEELCQADETVARTYRQAQAFATLL